MQQLQIGWEISKLVCRVATVVFRYLYFLLRIELLAFFIHQFLQALYFLSEFIRNWNIVWLMHYFQF